MNPKILIFSLVLLSILTGCKSDSKKSTDAKTEEVKEEAMPATEVAMNTLTQSEIDDGWVLLFDGKTPEGWRGYKKDHFPNGKYLITRNILMLN